METVEVEDDQDVVARLQVGEELCWVDWRSMKMWKIERFTTEDLYLVSCLLGERFGRASTMISSFLFAKVMPAYAVTMFPYIHFYMCSWPPQGGLILTPFNC